MQNTTITSTSSDRASLEDAAARAERWYGEPFLHPGEEADVALAPGTARRRALDDAEDEMAATRPNIACPSGSEGSISSAYRLSPRTSGIASWAGNRP